MTAERVTTFKIFVGNLPLDTTADEVRKIFEEYGNVVECNSLAQGTKAFVHMEDDIEGKHAVGELQNKELNGNTLIIEESKTYDLPRIPTVNLNVKNVSPTVDARGLRNMFKRFGYIIEVDLLNGEGYVALEATGDIRSAIKEMNGHTMDDMVMEVEPAPIQNKSSDSPKKNANKNKGKNNYGQRSTWGNKYGNYSEPQPQYNDYSEEYGYDYGDSSYYDDVPPRVSYHEQPERILRDPKAHRAQPHQRFQGPANPRFRDTSSNFGGPGGSHFMGHRAPHPRPLFQAPPPHFGPGDRVPILRPEIPPPMNHFGGQFANQMSNPWAAVSAQEVFYEDEPLPSSSRPREFQVRRKTISGANSVPVGLGGGASGNRQSMPLYTNPPFRGRNGGAHRGVRRDHGGGFGRPQPKFTALTHEVAPGEKYPVPPMQNPGFRAPQKWRKEEVKRKVKRKKQPLIPAELPDYTLPVPEIPKSTVPHGAVLKPFPAPFGLQNYDEGGLEGSGPFNFTSTNGNSSATGGSSQNTHMDFTSDDFN